jgi:hypothetical protein
VHVDNLDEPAAPIPSLHDAAVLEVTRQRDRLIARGGIAGQIKAFVIVQDLCPIGQSPTALTNKIRVALLRGSIRRGS